MWPNPNGRHVIWYDPIWISGSNTFQNELITLASAQRLSRSGGLADRLSGTVHHHQPRSDHRQLRNRHGQRGCRSHLPLFHERTTSQNHEAIQHNRVYVIESDIIDRGGRAWSTPRRYCCRHPPGPLWCEDQTRDSVAQSPGFGVISLAFAFLAVILIRLKR